MADAGEVAGIAELIPDDSREKWNDAKIAQMLDAGNSKAKIMVQFWNGAAANTASFVSVMESGSSRDLSSIHKQALDMAKYWQGILDAEDKAEQLQKPGIRIHQIVRGPRG